MTRENKKNLFISLGLLLLFLLWTVAVKFLEVEAIGPEGSEVGFATVNEFMHKLTGMNELLYDVTDLLSIIPFLFILGFAVLGLYQLIKGKSFKKIDCDILVLGVFYVVVMAFFLFFEVVVINYRPVLIEGELEASYPSSTTMLVMCVMPTAMLQLKSRIKNVTVKRIALIGIALFTAFMVVGRIISGVHWITDIIGGAILSAGLVMLYYTFSTMQFKGKGAPVEEEEPAQETEAPKEAQEVNE